MQSTRRWWSYENTVLAILSLGWGFLFLERLDINYLMPSMVKDLHLSNADVGFIAAGFSLTWAFSGYFGGYLGDLLGRRKPILIISVLTFSVCSFITGLATGFLLLLVFRMVMGLLEGPFFPAGQSVLLAESSDSRRGFNLGFLQNFPSNALGGIAGPIIIVALATAFGWRNAFFFTVIPGIVVALLMWKFMREPKQLVDNSLNVASHGQQRQTEKTSPWEVFKYGNMIICMVISVCLIPWYTLLFSYAPLYLTEVRGMSPHTMSYLMSSVGLGAAVWGFVVPMISDKWGRKPTMILFCLISILGPLSVMYLHGPIWLLMVVIFVGSAGPGCMALYMSIIPAETVPRKNVGAAIGLAMASGELVGGVGLVSAGGVLANHFGLVAPLLMSGGFALIAALVAVLLRETAPLKLQKRLAAKVDVFPNLEA
ncbi:MFS transporter [Alicyclobacillus dauci]|uniref:MFS transporter n=1 Tax=Alicyclobacillus dauci TaxID=1475485 RepID=A0ABY6YZ25_9BACL|nr:MFS transporter [Alicyclobacillus dauci]WAH35709.1 MFS transporter [Alicyclobacillus dauci]